MHKKKRDVRSILLITLSNLGDMILTTPVLVRLSEEFPDAFIDIIGGSSSEDVFKSHPQVRKVMNIGRRPTLSKRLDHLFSIRRGKYDLIVDLKNSLMPFLAGAKTRSKNSFLSFSPGKTKGLHKKNEHLLKLSGVVEDPFFVRDGRKSFFISVSEKEKKDAAELIANARSIFGVKKNIAVNPGAKSHLKRWGAENYAELINILTGKLGSIVFVTGSNEDKEVADKITTKTKGGVVDLSGKTSLGVLTELIKHMDLVITNDSAPLHVASAVNAPTVALFGPTDEQKYGPLAERSVVLTPKVKCRPCGKALCGKGRVDGCISDISVGEVVAAVERVLCGS